MFVWGYKMGLYPNVELVHADLTSKQKDFAMEIHQSKPRLVRGNLLYYKIKKVVCGPFNSGAITDKGDLLLQGSNHCAQLGFDEEFGKLVQYFPHYKKVDFFKAQKLTVQNVSIGANATYVLCNSDG